MSANTTNIEISSGIHEYLDDALKKIKAIHGSLDKLSFVLYLKPSIALAMDDEVEFSSDTKTEIAGINIQYAKGYLIKDGVKITVVKSEKVSQLFELMVFPSADRFITFKSYSEALRE